MKVLHINGNYIGTALHQTMIEHLDKYTDNQVFAPIYPITNDQLSMKPNSNVIISQCYKKRDRYVFGYKQHKIIKSLETHINVPDFDCIHAYTLFTDGNCAYELSKKYKKPFIVAVRDSDVNAFFKKAIHLRHKGIEIMRHASRILFLSKAYKDAVFNNYVPKRLRTELDSKSMIIPNGINELWLSNRFFERDIDGTVLRLAKKELRLVTVGVISKRKNILATIEAIKILQDKGWKVKLTAVGQPIDDDVMQAVLACPFVDYYGKQPLEKVIDFYRTSDIFVMPSLTETFGLTYAEAITQLLPVIYSKGQGFDGQFPDGEVGYSVESSSPKDIADKIIQVSSNYKDICEHCKNVGDVFDWNRIVETYYEVYTSITKK